MDLGTAIDFARTTTRSVLVTMRRDGRPQLSNVLHQIEDDGTIRISSTRSRAKFRNLARQPWAALHVTREDFYAYAVIEADVTIMPFTTSPDDATADALLDHYRALMGDPADEAAFRASQVADGRSLALLAPTRAYGMLQLPGSAD